MHFEKGSYDETWVEGFFEAAKKRGLAEIGISEHSHTFPEFKDLYYEDLVLDDSFIGTFQQQWLKSNKFKYTLDEYFAFMHKLQQKHRVKIGIEVCNFQDQAKVRDILKDYDFDYIIGSVHFLRGWAYDSSEIKAEWEKHSLEDIYEWYTEEVEKLAAHYDLPIITTSDAHKPEDCGNYNEMAVDYAKSFGYAGSIRFDKRQRTLVSFDLE